MVREASPSAEPTIGPNGSTHRTARLIAIVAGLLGTLLAVATPLLPVNQTTAELNWPQNGVLASVNAPLIGYVATDLEITVPCSAAAGLDQPGRTVLLSTVPKQAPKAIDRGLLIERVNNDLLVIVRNTPVVSAPLDQVLSPACEELTFSAHADKVTGEFVGLKAPPDGDTPAGQEEPLKGERGGYDFRPQIVGVFTDLSGPAPPGLEFSATIDSRYSTSPTLLKLLAMIIGVAMTIVALGALHVLDNSDGMRHRRFLPPRWWSMSPLDGLVTAVLVWWHFVGANTADDGYILTMARVSENAGYMANYYRWFGTPEAPFGWYYDLLAMWAHVSTTSVWMRLPTLVMGLACWWVISREVIPRLGTAVKHSRAAAWTAAGLFLAFWLPLNNGLRPEPIIALGILLTWCSVERGVATSRLLPVAVAIIIGALTLFSGPTGIAAVGALLVAIGPLKTIVARHTSRFGYAALLAPIAAAATVTIILIFRDQTLAAEMQASSFKSAVGPSLAWFDEHIRYSRLFTTTPDGSVARRFAVLTLLLALAVAVAMSLRKGRIPGTALGPGRRIIGITIIAFLAMMFTPTKWTHHFGVFAGLAGSLGALAAVAVSAAAMSSRRNRTLFAAAVLFVTALSFATVNGWWYVSNFGVPWSNSFPEWKFGFHTILLGLSVLALLVAAWFHFSGRAGAPPNGGQRRWKSIAQAPLATATWALVTFEVLSLTLAMTGQYPAWTVGRSNLEALTGKTCGMAEDVMVEQDPNVGLLQPIGLPIGDALGGGTTAAAGTGGTTEGFSPNGIPSDVSADPVMDQPGSDNFADSETTDAVENEAGTEGGTTVAAGVNGSRARLPFGLDPARTPVLGSWRSGTQQPARLRSAWYRLPAGWSEKDRSDSLLVVSAAGRFDNGEVVVQWAGNDPDGEPAGTIELGDVGAAPAWRNLRAPLSAIPDEATRIRLVATDDDLSPQHWIALTPPRIPDLRTLQAVVGSTEPVLLDWLVGLAFPCQRPYSHRNGVIEVPKWRILPDRFGAEANSPVMDYLGGGPLGITELLLRPTTVPTYLKDDWLRDWGALQQLTPFYPSAEPARLDLGSATRSGLWSPAPMRLRSRRLASNLVPDRTTRLIAIVAGVLGLFLCALAPLLPVKQTTATIQWPQTVDSDGNISSVTAPLVSGAPRSLDVVIPCQTVASLPADGGLVLSTIPPGGIDAGRNGLFVRAYADTVVVAFRDSVAAVAPRDAVESGACSILHLWADFGAVGADFAGIPGASGTLAAEKRPQVAGLFSELEVSTDSGVSATVDIDTRFITTPTTLKLAVMILGVICVVASIVALALLDRTSGRRVRWVRGRRHRVGLSTWLADAGVVSALLVWHLVGAQSSDDGYNLTMARVSGEAGYTANYYRFFGATEAPFDWYQSILAHLASISTAGIWMRLPATAAAIGTWLILSRCVLPRLGGRLARNRIAVWTAGAVFLAAWLPFNNGLRPEPLIAFGVIAVWMLVEMTLGSRRLAPVALAIIVAVFCVTLAPQGMVALAPLLVAARAITRIVSERRTRDGLAAQLAPLAAAASLIFVVVFRDQTLATVAESARIKYVVGPTIPWYQEFLRYYFLTVEDSVDASLTRRFSMLILLLCLFGLIMVLLRRGGVPGTVSGPVWRLTGTVAIGLLLLVFTPTKWAAQFGVFAGVAGALGAVTAFAFARVGLHSRRNLALYVTALLFVLAESTSGINGWFYVANYGVPWFDKQPVIFGQPVTNLFLVLAIACGLLAGWLHFRMDYAGHTQVADTGRNRALASTPLLVVAAIMVVLELGSMLKATAGRYPVYTNGAANLSALGSALTGSSPPSCAMADAVLVEADTNAGMLQPVPGQRYGKYGPLGGEDPVGFTPNGVSDSLDPAEPVAANPGLANSDGPVDKPNIGVGYAAGTGGGYGPRGVNGSRVFLPFGLDPDRTPVMGSFDENTVAAEATSVWYQLPPRTPDRPLVTVAAAGAIWYYEEDGSFNYGQSLKLQWGVHRADGSYEALSEVQPIDIFPQKAWRNLRFPLASAPPEANVARIVADDPNLSEDQWFGFTPPRVPVLTTAQDFLGSQTPVLLDIATAANFPCQRPFSEHLGVAELPEYRILPNFEQVVSSSNQWQSAEDGGPFLFIQALLRTATIPTYLRDDWYRDWGSIERYIRVVESDQAPDAVIEEGSTRVFGWSRGGPIRALP